MEELGRERLTGGGGLRKRAQQRRGATSIRPLARTRALSSHYLIARRVGFIVVRHRRHAVVRGPRVRRVDDLRKQADGIGPGGEVGIVINSALEEEAGELFSRAASRAWENFFWLIKEVIARSE